MQVNLANTIVRN